MEEIWFQALRELLAKAVGPGVAMTLDELTVRAGLPSRRVTEQVMEQRLSDFPFVLVAGGQGYWIPTAADQINAYLHNLHSRHRRMQLREATVRRKARVAGWPLRQDGARFEERPGVQLELFR